MSSQETKSSQCKEKVSAAAATPQELAAHPLAASGGQSPLSAAGAAADVAPAPATVKWITRVPATLREVKGFWFTLLCRL